MTGSRPAGQFRRSVAVLASGTAISQAIPIAAMPVLTRLYTPEEFGTVALYLALASLLGVVATARYELAIPLPSDDTEAAEIGLLALKICVATSLVVLGAVAALGGRIADLLGDPRLAPWLYLLPATIMATGLYSVCQLWCNRMGRYRAMSINRVQHSGATAAGNIAMGAAGVSGGLIVGSLIGQAASATLIASRIWRADRATLRRTTRAGQRRLAARYAFHPLHLVPSHFVGVTALQLPVLMVGVLFATGAAGFYSVAHRVVSIGSSTVANAIGDVYRQQAAKEYRDRGSFETLFLRTLRTTALLAVVPFAIVYLAAPAVAEWVLGPPWRIAGDYARILAVSGFFQFVFTPVDKGALVVGATRYIFAWQAARLAGLGSVLAIAVGASLHIEQVLWSIVGVNVVLYIVDGIVEHRLSRGRRHAD
jgi:O-antigen/teichoic acid export membrane protein